MYGGENGYFEYMKKLIYNTSSSEKTNKLTSMSIIGVWYEKKCPHDYVDEIFETNHLKITGIKVTTQ